MRIRDDLRPRSRPRRWHATLLAGAGLAALALSPASAQIGGSVPGCTTKPIPDSGTFTAKLHTPGHHPHKWRYIYDRDEKKKAWAALWPITITAKYKGRPISGKVTYQFLFNNQIVACRTVLAPYKPRFTHGIFHDRIEWPEKSVGFPLVFRAIVKTHYGVKNLDYSVRVSPRPRH